MKNGKSGADLKRRGFCWLVELARSAPWRLPCHPRRRR